MPELPEVETIKNVLEPILKGHTITSIDIIRSCTIVGSEEEFVSTLVGKTFQSISRIGKFLIFHLSENIVFISHLRMEGKYFELEENEKNTYFCRLVFHLNNGHKICYDDSRCFGMMKLAREDNYKQVKDIAQLGPEPFDVTDVNYLIKRCVKSSLPIKTTLLDQTLMCGIGNIYADEILFASKIHPLTPAKIITKSQWEAIVKHAQRILNEAIELGGSTIRSYHPGKNIDGSFQTNLLAYGKADKPCPVCGHIMRFIKVNGRGTTFCPHCQEKLGHPLKIAIFGKIASGKSTVLSVFKENGYPTISSDEIVKNLYKQQDVVVHVNKMFGIKPENVLDKDALRSKMLDDSNKRKLERYIHPLVGDAIDAFLKQRKGLLVAEVPLLYEAKMEDKFDVIIAVDIDNEKQAIRLAERNKETAKVLSNINNRNNRFDENKKKADFVINNNSDLSNLKKQVNEIICKLITRLS